MRQLSRCCLEGCLSENASLQNTKLVISCTKTAHDLQSNLHYKQTDIAAMCQQAKGRGAQPVLSHSQLKHELLTMTSVSLACSRVHDLLNTTQKANVPVRSQLTSVSSVEDSICVACICLT